MLACRPFLTFCRRAFLTCRAFLPGLDCAAEEDKAKLEASSAELKQLTDYMKKVGGWVLLQQGAGASLLYCAPALRCAVQPASPIHFETHATTCLPAGAGRQG